MNFGTAYLDGSGVYGATPESADKLREFEGGFLKVTRPGTLARTEEIQLPSSSISQPVLLQLSGNIYF